MKSNRFINIGYGNVVSTDRIICAVSPESAPIKRLVQEAKDAGKAIDATYGRRTRSVIIMDSGNAVLTPLNVETIAQRLNNEAVNEHIIIDEEAQQNV